MHTDDKLTPEYVCECISCFDYWEKRELGDFERYWEQIERNFFEPLKDAWKRKDTKQIEDTYLELAQPDRLPADPFQRQCYWVALNSYPFFMCQSLERDFFLLKTVETLYYSRPAASYIFWLARLGMESILFYDVMGNSNVSIPDHFSTQKEYSGSLRFIDVYERIRLFYKGESFRTLREKVSEKNRDRFFRFMFLCEWHLQGLLGYFAVMGANETVEKIVIGGLLLKAGDLFIHLKEQICLVDRFVGDDIPVPSSFQNLQVTMGTFIQQVKYLENLQDGTMDDLYNALKVLFDSCRYIERLRDLWISQIETIPIE